MSRAVSLPIEKAWFSTAKALLTPAWKSKGNRLFQRRNDLFFSVTIHFVKATPELTEVEIELEYKPIGLDDLFWMMIGEEEPSKGPLSLRFWATRGLRGYRLLERSVSAIGAHPETIEPVLQEIEGLVDRVSGENNPIERFADRLTDKSNRWDGEPELTRVVALVLAKRHREANAAIKAFLDQERQHNRDWEANILFQYFAPSLLPDYR